MAWTSTTLLIGVGGRPLVQGGGGTPVGNGGVHLSPGGNAAELECKNREKSSNPIGQKSATGGNHIEAGNEKRSDRKGCRAATAEPSRVGWEKDANQGTSIGFFYGRSTGEKAQDKRCVSTLGNHLCGGM